MEVKELKNYGKPLIETTYGMPKEVGKEVMKSIMSILKKHLGLLGVMQFTFLITKEMRMMLKERFISVRGKGLKNEKFIKQLVRHAAFYSVLLKMKGREKANEILDEIAELAAAKVSPSIFPTAEDFGKFDDSFEAFKEWYLALVDADQKAGAQFFEVVENTGDALQINYTYCVWFEIPKKLGVEEACLSSCNADDLFFPDYCREIGVGFKRAGIIAKGADCCDFRFERVKDNPGAN
ncbi:MAG: L-2-amino-thiazoline-4-carboxylic acid hydrolase [Deltaproteobacteria bacterium]|nr:MAG: L-2-amino-thiazoline-4-carboxylic acid hydrolase [Deltaproteobacteria bacterium]